MPALLAVPISVPTVSKQSHDCKGDDRRNDRQHTVREQTAEIKLEQRGRERDRVFRRRWPAHVVRPIGMPISVVAMMPRSIAPLTFHAISTPVISRPISASAGPLVRIAPRSEKSVDSTDTRRFVNHRANKRNDIRIQQTDEADEQTDTGADRSSSAEQEWRR